MFFFLYLFFALRFNVVVMSLIRLIVIFQHE